MEVEEFRDYLIELNAEITFTKHFHERQRFRKIAEATIREHLTGCERLLEVQDKGLTETGRHTFSLLFETDDEYDLRIVISIKGKDLRVVTAHIQDVRKRRGLGNWPGSSG